MANTFNKDFAVPEMVKTARENNKHFERSVIISFILLVYVIFMPFAKDIDKFTILGADLPINYITHTIIVLFLLYQYFSQMNYIYIQYILYRQIDEEVKSSFAIGEKDPNYDIDVSSHMTSLIISDNIFSSIIFAGSERHPSIKRLLSINLYILSFYALALCFFIITIMLRSDNIILDFSIFSNIENMSLLVVLLTIYICIFVFYKIYIIFIMLAAIIITLILISKYSINNYLVNRSSFLKKSSFIKDAYFQFYDILKVLDHRSKTKQDRYKALYDHFNSIFNSIRLNNICDNDSYILQIIAIKDEMVNTIIPYDNPQTELTTKIKELEARCERLNNLENKKYDFFLEYNRISTTDKVNRLIDLIKYVYKKNV
jgi:hypothetical protein